MTADRKTVVIDTNAFIAAGRKPLFNYEGQEVVIPFVVLRELDKLKSDDEKGWGARDAIKALFELILCEDGQTKRTLNSPVVIDKKGGTLVVELNHVDETDLPAAIKNRSGRDQDYDNDVRILAVAKNLKDVDGRDVLLVSNDAALCVQANSIGLSTAEFANVRSDHGGEFSGVESHWVSTEVIDTLYANKEVVVELDLDEDSRFGVNFGVVLDSGAKKGMALCKAYDKFEGKATLKKLKSPEAFGLKPRSSEQAVALAHLLDPEIGIVSLAGRAGTGKTALALASALEQIMESKPGECTYEKILVFRSPHAVGGQDLGFLPGDGEEKMAPWSAAVWDALGSIASKNVRDEIGERELIEVLPMTHIRGRSLNNAFVIIDEAQNLELPTLMTAISRLGEGSKVVLTWDITQRDNLHVGRYNGVAAAVNAMAGEPIFAHTTLKKTERSKIAELASRVLEDLQA